MILVELGELRLSPRVAEAMTERGFDTAPYLFEHKRGSAGDLETADEIFAHVTDVCRGLRVSSVHETEQGTLRIVTASGRTSLAFATEVVV